MRNEPPTAAMLEYAQRLWDEDEVGQFATAEDAIEYVYAEYEEAMVEKAEAERDEQIERMIDPMR